MRVKLNLDGKKVVGNDVIFGKGEAGDLRMRGGGRPILIENKIAKRIKNIFFLFFVKPYNWLRFVMGCS